MTAPLSLCWSTFLRFDRRFFSDREEEQDSASEAVERFGIEMPDRSTKLQAESTIQYEESSSSSSCTVVRREDEPYESEDEPTLELAESE